jgi:hypothetical protein
LLHNLVMFRLGLNRNSPKINIFYEYKTKIRDFFLTWF